VKERDKGIESVKEWNKGIASVTERNKGIASVKERLEEWRTRFEDCVYMISSLLITRC
jgi:hypothetical protein